MQSLIATLAVMAVLDGIWLGLVARTFYRRYLGYLMAETPNWLAAGAFYLIYAIGVAIFVVQPAVDEGSLLTAAWRGGLFGFVAYATYDLTNMATLRGWPTIVTIVDMAWGTVLTAAVGAAAYGLVTWLT